MRGVMGEEILTSVVLLAKEMMTSCEMLSNT
jgi:hypothetical protein